MHLLDILESVDQVIQSVTLYGPEITKLECLKEHARCNKCLERFFGSLGQVVHIIPELGQRLQEVLELLPEVHKILAGELTAQK